MRIKYVIFCLLALEITNTIWADEFNRKTMVFPNSQYKLAEETLQTKQFEASKKFEILSKIKYLIIRGNLDYAKVLLKEASISTDFSKPIQLRYLAMIYFIEGKYQLALDILNRKELATFQAEPRVCFIRTLSLVILDKENRAKKAWEKCFDSTLSYSSTDLLWMRTLVSLKINDNKSTIENIFKDISVENLDKESLRIYLKLALYLNQQDKVIPRFKFFSEEVLSDTTLRELIGFNYYRAGQVEKAYSVIESLNTANSEIFKGNLYSFQERYDLAYAQYKLALNLKNNSLNAIDRLIPLSWKLGQYKEGLKFLQKNPVTPKNKVEHYTLMAAFLTLDDKTQSSEQVLDQVIEFTNRGEPLEVSQLISYNSVKQHKTDKTSLFSGSSCQKYDGINCWINAMVGIWPEAFEKEKSKQKIHGKDFKYIPDELTLLIKDESFEEVNPLDQKKIEEMDNNLINLLPENN